MKKKDYLIVTLAPLPVLLIPLIGVMSSQEWKWTWHDFLGAWVILAATTFAYRLLVSRKSANLTYRLGAGLAVVTGFFITWTNLAVQIIGDENPGNGLYFLVILAGMIGVGLSRFHPAGLAKVAFSMAVAFIAVPVVAVLLWPTDFNPGFPKVLLLSSFFAAAFTGSGLLFRHAAGQTGGAGMPTPVAG
jgi:hypothetical protein